MDIEKEYDELMEFFGEANITTEYFFDPELEILDPKQFSSIKLTFLPLNQVIIGDKYPTQIENAVDALRRLKPFVKK